MQLHGIPRACGKLPLSRGALEREVCIVRNFCKFANSRKNFEAIREVKSWLSSCQEVARVFDLDRCSREYVFSDLKIARFNICYKIRAITRAIAASRSFTRTKCRTRTLYIVRSNFHRGKRLSGKIRALKREIMAKGQRNTSTSRPRDICHAVGSIFGYGG